MSACAPHVLAHRACLYGPGSVRENSRAALAQAVAKGFGVEFDVNRDGDRLTLAHDPEPWSEELDAETFLRDPGPGVHALNVKSFDAIGEALRVIDEAGTHDSFFLFDFELLGAGAGLMEDIQTRGFRVAHRVSEREPHLARYLDDPAVTDVWLDEFDWPWLREEHVQALADCGKRTYYVSPELHHPQPVQKVALRWDDVCSWGVTGVCTDYPIHLREELTVIKAVIFDMDGVLVDADKWHYNALNVALQHADVEPISWREHLTVYKGIPTREKLRILTERKGLDPELWPLVAKTKQEVTQQIIESFSQPDGEKIEMLRLLSRRYPIVVCSNSIRATVDVMLDGAGLTEFIDFTLSNEDIERPKPDPQVFVAAFERLGVRPEECVVIEDSDVGKAAAAASGAVLCSVNDPADVNYYRVLRTIRESDRINVVIPAAGQGKRFAEVGYQHPKPLIDVEGRPMIDLVLDNFRGVGRPIVLMQERHIEQYCAADLVKSLAPDGEVVGVDGLTEGAACTVLLAESLIDGPNELVLANSDQVVDVSIEAFVREMRDRDADGGILTFRADDPKWSYARTDPDGRVLQVAEKVVISEQATVGIYYFRHGSDFVRFAKQMIANDVRFNNEFYVCPVFNELLHAGLDVFTSEIEPRQMHGLGTPEDLEAYTAWRSAVPLTAAA